MSVSPRADPPAGVNDTARTFPRVDRRKAAHSRAFLGNACRPHYICRENEYKAGRLLGAGQEKLEGTDEWSPLTRWAHRTTRARGTGQDPCAPGHPGQDGQLAHLGPRGPVTVATNTACSHHTVTPQCPVTKHTVLRVGRAGRWTFKVMKTRMRRWRGMRKLPQASEVIALMLDRAGDWRKASRQTA